ncbi:PREDICTED: transcription factor Adf-1-like [Diuraphis noxia]|uniref:transcription factor Adf-1-like n=1 Tax=Diuraphis noxia TaxID=143948 RepID=UPI00076358F9|nr:PREDICTED: transcription factor Adf-1-like [Diuraphis noxia]
MEEQLIVEVEKRPVLYDKSLGTYKNATYREEIWKEVANELKNDDVNTVKKRWRSLRDTFIKMHKSQKQPSGSGGGKKSKWSYYSQMTFLIPYIRACAKKILELPNILIFL